MNKHKAIIIPYRICENNKNMFVTVNPRNSCKIKFSDNLWFLFLDQPQSDIFYLP